MPKKTLALISGLVLVTVVLFIIALRSGQQSNPNSVTRTPVAVSPTVSVAHSILALSPNPMNVLPGSLGKVDVNIDTSDNPVTAVQLEISFDPKAISNVQVTPGILFQNAAVLIGNTHVSNKNSNQTGKFTFAFGKTPGQTPVTGIGSVAVISFTAGVASSSSQLNLLPTTLVTARGVANSVLKTSTGTKVIVGSNGVVVPSTQSSPSAVFSN